MVYQLLGVLSSHPEDRHCIFFFPFESFKLLCFTIPVIWRENKAVTDFLGRNCFAYVPFLELSVASGL